MDQNLTKIRHDRSLKDFPKLRLDEDEYVEMVFGRSKNSLLFSLAGLGLITAVILLVMLLLLVSEIVAGDMGISFILIVLLILAATDFIAATFIYMVEKGNQLFFTNKRLIQIMVNIPFLESQRSVNLSGISHIDYDQNTILERILHLGTLKFSTHEKNVMILEDEAPKPAVTLFRDNSGNVFTFPKVNVSHQQLEEINELVTNAPKLGHKMSENITELDHDNI